MAGPADPHRHTLVACGFGLPYTAFVRHYLRHTVWYLFLRLLRCFSSAGSLSHDASAGRSPQDVLFGDPRIRGSLRLPSAYRGLARPSSAPEPSHSPDGGVATTSRKWDYWLCISPGLVRMHDGETRAVSKGHRVRPVASSTATRGVIAGLGGPASASGAAYASASSPPDPTDRVDAPSSTCDALTVRADRACARQEDGPDGIRTHGLLLAKQAIHR